MISLSVIIPTYNRLESLIKVLAALEKQQDPDALVEVVVISDGSKDGTSEYLQNLKPAYSLDFVVQENKGVAAARNAGIIRSSGDIVVFLDDDVVPDPQFLQEHLSFHQRYGSDAIVIGPMLTPDDARLAPWVRWEQEKLEKQYKAMRAGKWKPTARQFYTGNVSLARVHLVEVGGFNPAFRRAEDVELAYRLAAKGLQFYFNPSAIGYHYAIRSFNSWLKVPYSYGRNDVIFSGTKSQKWLLPLIFEEYQKRHFISRLIVCFCLDHPHRSKLLTFFLKKMLPLVSRINTSYLSNTVCSILFHLNYYQGVSDGLGGRGVFYSGILQAPTALENPKVP